MSDAIGKLSALLIAADAKVTFDPERDYTKPCFSCEAAGPNTLVDLSFGTRKVTRPFCTACVKDGKPAQTTEREVDHRTIVRLLGQAKEQFDESELYRKALEFYAARPNWTKMVMRRIPVGGGMHGLRQVNLMQMDEGETARKALGRA